MTISYGCVHLERVMGTVVGFTSPRALPRAAISEAVEILHEADRVFSTWHPNSPMSRVRSGQAELSEIDSRDATHISRVLARCDLARRMSRGAFDPWAMPGGVDPTGLVKGWAVGEAMRAFTDFGVTDLMINAGGDIAVAGRPAERPWTVGVRHPDQPEDYAAVIEVDAAIATSGNYERPGELIDPRTGRSAGAAASATVTGPELDLADALATGLAVGGRPVLEAIEGIPGFEGYLITRDGRHYGTSGMRFAGIGPVKSTV